MSLRVKEICKERNIQLKDLADKLGITPVSLTQSLNGNPTLSRLTEIAIILDVEVADLFSDRSKEDVHGCIYVKGKPNLINNVGDIRKLLEKLDSPKKKTDESISV